MGKARKHPRVKSSGFVPDYLQTAVEPDDFAYSGRIDSQMKRLEETPPLKRRRFGLNGDSYGVPKEVLSLANMSRSERKNLVHKLKMELQQVRDLSKKIACFSSDTVLLSPYNDIQSCSDGPRRMPPENFATIPGSQGKKRPAVRNDKQRTKKGPSRLDVPANSTVASVMKECETLLNRLWSHKLGWAFRTPVDPVMLNIPDYFTVIKHPMDLGTIRSRLRKGEYSSPLDFAADVRLTFSNSIAYNPPGNQYHAMAQGISKYFESGWKSIEKNIPVTKPPVVPVTSSASLDSEIPFEVAPLRKKAATMNENKQSVAPAKLVMTDDEKKKLSQDLVALEEDFPQNIVDLLREQSGNDGQSGEVEIEIDIESLSDETLFKVRKLLDDYLSEKKKSLEKSEPCEMEIVHDSGFSNSPLQPSKGDLQIDEDVDIVGGNDPSVSSHPPPKIEKDAACRNNESSSSSSSSSESGSSSSDSGSSSSSGSETDSNKASKPTSREDKKEPGVGVNRKEDNCNSEKIVVNDSLNELGQLRHAGGEKSTAMDALVVPDEETAPPGRQISPDKRYRQALLKNRFADTIMKAREKALTKGEKGDPEKLRIEREEFEKRLREEKVRLQAEAKAAEEVRRKAKAEAAEKVRREREQEREAARQALQKMEKTVEINEGIRFMEDLQMFRATGSEGDQLPTSMDEMSPKCSEDMLGSFKMEGSNPLAHLGLYMKMDEDEDEDEEEDPPHFSQREVEDHLTDRSEKQELSPSRVEREDQLVSGNEEPVSQKVHDSKDQEDEKPINPNEREEKVGNVPEQESRVVDKEEQETKDVDMREQKNEVVDMGVEEEHSLDRSKGRTLLSPHRKEGEDQLVSGNEEVSEKVEDYGNQKDEKPIPINHNEKEELVENVLEQESKVDDKGERETKVVEMGEQENEVVDKGVEKELPLDTKEGQILSSHREEVEDQLVSGNEELGSQKTDNENEEYENPINQNEREEQVTNVPGQESRVTEKEDQETEVVDMGEQKSEVIEKGVEENENVDKGVQGNEVVEKGGKGTEVVDNGEDDETDLVDKGEQATDVVDKAAEKETDLVDEGEEETEDVDVEID